MRKLSFRKPNCYFCLIHPNIKSFKKTMSVTQWLTMWAHDAEAPGWFPVTTPLRKHFLVSFWAGCSGCALLGFSSS